MTERHVSETGPGDTDGASDPPPPEKLSWPVVIGLGALSGLWPLAELSGLRDLIGPAGTALLVLAVIAGTWIGGVGFFEVPRPVLTLTLAGTVFGGVLVILSLAFGLRPEVTGRLAVLVAVFEVARSTALGALAGLVASAVQQGRRPRR
jgi:hypothetical protein